MPASNRLAGQPVGVVTASVPVLASLDLNESLDFYQRLLGFRAPQRFEDYAMVRRDGVELHFWLCSDRRIAEHTGCYLRSPDVDALHREFAQRGLALPPPADRPWGMRELYVIDPHGNLLKFGQPVAVAPAGG